MSKKFKAPAQFDAGLILPASAANGRVLMSDAVGNGAWSDALSGGGRLYSGTGAPPSTVGVAGDFWLDKLTGTLYGPKGSNADSLLNLHPNPSVETNTTNWNSSGSSGTGASPTVRERTQDWAAHGVWSYHHSQNRIPAANTTVQTTSCVAGLTGKITVDPAKSYACQITHRVRLITSITPQIRCYFYWFKSDGTASAITTATGGNYSAVEAGGVYQFRATVTPPSDAVLCGVALYGAATDLWEGDTDAVVFVEGTTLPMEWPTTGVNIMGAAGGDLSGYYPSPTIAPGVIVNADVNAAAAIAESKLALASDAAANVASRRTLGPGALQAAPGNDARFAIERPGCYMNGSQTFTGVTPLAWTPATGASAVRDSLSGVNGATATYTIPVAGTYRITLWLQYVNAAAGAQCAASLSKNGGSVSPGQGLVRGYNGVATMYPSGSGMTEIACAVGDTIRPQLWHSEVASRALSWSLEIEQIA